MFQNIRDIILANRFYVVQTTSIKFSQESARTFYQEHKNKFFYHRLVSFMTSGSVDVHILAREDAVTAWRVLMGPTKVYQAQFSDPNTIRGSYGISDTRNATHGSDSPESAAREIALLFPTFDLHVWSQYQEPSFRAGKVELCLNTFVHKLLDTARTIKN
ncbi:unnamed protein product [Timema podura]|uniref:Nucleoside diphosphate kinase n=1 Tax=Timema podura TaxID=61482 RepID=A0ABN7NWT8_TIMPD|nr:unnamed protein product [Timema podura]